MNSQQKNKVIAHVASRFRMVVLAETQHLLLTAIKDITTMLRKRGILYLVDDGTIECVVDGKKTYVYVTTFKQWKQQYNMYNCIIVACNRSNG